MTEAKYSASRVSQTVKHAETHMSVKSVMVDSIYVNMYPTVDYLWLAINVLEVQSSVGIIAF